MIERIQAKLTELSLQEEQALAALNAIIGAKQALQQLLEPEPKPKKQKEKMPHEEQE